MLPLSMDAATWIELIKLALLLALIAYLLVYLRRGAIYLPSHPKAVEQMIQALGIMPGDKAVDLGSGDGRIVIAMAKAGADATGYEVNPPLVWISRRNALKANVADHAHFVRKSFWRANFSDVQCLTIFGMTHIMKELEEKLMKELPVGARVVSNGFKFPNWKGEQVAQGVYLYRKTG
jgi:tRNA A58 N-methylase Trm61